MRIAMALQVGFSDRYDEFEHRVGLNPQGRTAPLQNGCCIRNDPIAIDQIKRPKAISADRNEWHQA
jgi:hypothetical protein